MIFLSLNAWVGLGMQGRHSQDPGCTQTTNHHHYLTHSQTSLWIKKSLYYIHIKNTEVNVYTYFLGVEVRGDYRNEN